MIYLKYRINKIHTNLTNIWGVLEKSKMTGTCRGVLSRISGIDKIDKHVVALRKK